MNMNLQKNKIRSNEARKNENKESYKNGIRNKSFYFFSLEGTLFASLAVWTAASADAASGVARRISHISFWHSLFLQSKKIKINITSICMFQINQVAYSFSQIFAKLNRLHHLFRCVVLN